MKRIKFKSSVYVIFIICLTLLSFEKGRAQGPNATEAASFEPVDATDMVNLVTGDMSYVLPLLNIPSPEGGYPIALSYHAGIAMDQEASWVGLGWSINPGAINRGVNGNPDDWGKTNINEFFYDYGYSEDYYNFSAGIRINNAVSVGLGASWGSNQSLGGYVSASVGPSDGGSIGVSIGTNGFSINGGVVGFNASVGTNGVGVGYGSKGAGGDPSIGVGLNYNYSSGLSGGVSVAQSSDTFGGKKGSIVKSSGLGISFSSSGTSINGKVNGYGAGISTSGGSVSGGDYDVTVSSTSFSLPIYTFYIGYGHQNVKYSLYKYNNLYTSGMLNPVVSNTLKLYSNGTGPSRVLYENSFMDVNVVPKYDDTMDVSSLLDNDDQLDKNNLILPNYDNYTVTAQGLSGSLRPYIHSELNLSARGRGGQNNDDIYTSYLNHDISEYNSAPSSGINVNRDAVKKVNFTMDNAYNSFLRMETSDIYEASYLPSVHSDYIMDYFKTNTTTNFTNTNSLNGDRKREGNYITTYTNKQIREESLIGFIEATGIDRYDTDTFLDEGIGAYRITTPDGRTYHYALPVYNFETIYKNFKNANDEDENFFEIQKTTPYATHWLLTAVTGPDYIDMNVDGKVDEGDQGYWVEFEYGKWSDGYAWQTPNGRYHENKNQAGETTYSYSWGRKQIYYLDAIKTRTHTALFVKDIREDNLSSNDINSYEQKWVSGNFDPQLHSKTFSSSKIVLFASPGREFYSSTGEKVSLPSAIGSCDPISAYEGLRQKVEYIDIPQNKSLYLSQIILLKNEDYTLDKDVGSLTPNLTGAFYSNYLYTMVKGIELGYGSCSAPDYFLRPAIIKEFDIHLHQNILDSKDIEGLDLESNAQQVISFDHDYSLAKGSSNSQAAGNGRLTLKNVNFKGKKGNQLIPPYRFSYYNDFTPFNKNYIDDWGYFNDFPHFWSLNEITTPTGGKIKVTYESDSYYAEAASYETKYFENITISRPSNNVVVTFSDGTNLADYFKVGRQVTFSFTRATMTNTGPSGIIPLNPIDFSTTLEVNAIHNSTTLWLTPTTETEGFDSYFTAQCPTSSGAYCYSELKLKNNQHPLYTNTDLNGKEGGGVRVKSLEVTDGIQKITTEYVYTDPQTNAISGITSYAPSKDEIKGLPYASELPAPTVTYGNVKMVNKDKNGSVTGSTAYTFETLQPFFEETGYLYSLGDAFKVKEQQDQTFENGKIIANKYTLYSSLGNIGRLLSVASYNKQEQKLNESSNQYKTGLDSDGEIGVTQETHKSIKRVLKTSAHDEYFYVNSSSRVSYPSVLESSSTTQGGFTSTTDFITHDFLTGQALETTTTDSEGKEFKNELVPAYSKYSDMGSKVDNLDNANMLTQSTMSKSYVKDNNSWEEIDVGITTWSPQNYYKTGTISIPPIVINYTIDKDIWRKHKTFIWNGQTDVDGLFTNFSGEDDGFNWNTTATSQSSEWKQISEISKYDKYSMPLEAVDINGNRSTTKMGDKDSKVFAVGNAGYDELFFSGAEDLDGSNYGGGVEKGTATEVDTYAHTGKKSLQIDSGQTGFKVSVVEGNSDQYKASLWVKYGNHTATRIKVGSNTISYNNGEFARFGDWVQLNFYFEVSSTQTVEVANTGTTIYVDDFRLCPLASSMTTYVYNEWDELTHILDANNIATQYEYDDAGRLVATDIEVVDFSTVGSGGFKEISTHRYSYNKDNY